MADMLLGSSARQIVARPPRGCRQTQQPARCLAQARGKQDRLKPAPAAALDSPVLEAGALQDVLPAVSTSSRTSGLISREALRELEGALDRGASVAALRRFNNAMDRLTAADWEDKLRAVMGELAYNLESFNPIFTLVLFKLQSTIGFSPYVARDMALKRLIQPLAGEYGMHNGQAQGKTHRELFSDFYADLLHAPLEGALLAAPRPPASVALFGQMTRDVLAGGGCSDPVDQAVYALGYNLAVEYLADYEKTWMLDSFRALNERVLAPQGRPLMDWLFLEVHAEGEKEHAALGHAAVMDIVPAGSTPLLARAMADHDRDFAVFYNHLANLLE